MYDSLVDTKMHMLSVLSKILIIVQDLIERASNHDKSKLESPEKEIFDKFTPRVS